MDVDAIPADMPLSPPPPGQTSNFGAKDLQPLLIGIQASFLSLMVIVLVARLYVRGFVSRNLWWEDFMAVCAALATIAHSVIICTLFQIGYGRHTWNVRLRNVLSGDALERLAGIALTYPLAVLFVKLSVAILYWRIFKVAGKAFRVATIAIMVFCIIFYLGIFAYAIVLYRVCGNAVTAGTNANCTVGSQVTTLVGGIGGVVTDVYLLMLPVVPLAKLKVGRNKKIGIWIVFTAGGLASSASVARLVTTTALQGSKDYLYLAAVEDIPSTIELCLGIVAASIPALGRKCESRAFKQLSSRVQYCVSRLVGLGRKASQSQEGSVDLACDNPIKSQDLYSLRYVPDMNDATRSGILTHAYVYENMIKE